MTTVTISAGTTSWTCPAGVTSVQVELWGGGGRGGERTTNGGGGGGGGGSYAKKTMSVVPGTIYNLAVGAGASAAGTAPGNGGDTWFGSTATALAKGGVSVGQNVATGAAALSTGSIGDTVAYAVAGSTGSASVGAAGSSSPLGGAGGAQITTQAAGNAGVVPGGGGGGSLRTSTSTRSGGAGAAGRIVITYTAPPTAPTLNPADKDPGVTLSRRNMRVTGVGQNAAQLTYCTEAKAANTGKFYFTCVVNSFESGNSNALIGIVGQSRPPRFDSVGFSDSYGIAFRRDGLIMANAQGFNSQQVAGFNAGDEVGVGVDTATGQVSFYVNGVYRGSATTIYTTYTPFVGPLNSDVMTVNFGAADFVYGMPAGYQRFYTPPQPFATTLNQVDANQYATVSNGDLAVTGTTSTGFSATVRATSAVRATDGGKYYEAHLSNPDGQGCAIGFIDGATPLDNNVFGGNAGAPGISWKGGYVYCVDGGTQQYVQVDSVPFPSGGVMGWYIRGDLGRAWVHIGGVWLAGNGYGGDPFAGGPGFPVAIGTGMYPALGAYWGTMEITTNFGSKPFVYKPADALAWDAAASTPVAQATLAHAQAYAVDYNYSTVSFSAAYPVGQAVIIAMADETVRDATFNGQAVTPTTLQEGNAGAGVRSFAIYIIPVTVAGNYAFTYTYNYTKFAGVAAYAVTNAKAAPNVSFIYKAPGDATSPIVAPTSLNFASGGVGIAAMGVVNGGGYDWGGDTRWTDPLSEQYDLKWSNGDSSYFAGAVTYTRGTPVSFTGQRYSGPNVIGISFDPISGATTTPARRPLRLFRFL